MVMRQRLLLVASAAVLIVVGWAVFGPARQAQAAGGFAPPLPTPLTVLRGFAPPTQRWLPGNRGVDLGATTGEPVTAAADGVVLYAGLLAGRGVVSISHGAVRTTYEPVDPVVARGESVRRGESIGRVSAVADGCGPPGGCLHWGAIRGDAYVDPLGLLAAPKVRLLPIWADGLPTSAASADAAGWPRPTAPSAPPRGTSRPADVGAATALAAAGAVTTGVGAAAAIATRRLTRSPQPGGGAAAAH